MNYEYMNKKISVIVPVFQVKNYLEKCISSILMQTYRNIEIILVDDGSTDGSEIICDQFAHSDERILVLHKKNGGLSSARNVGLKHASGEYVTFVDGDDWVSKDFLFQLYDSCEKNNADICQCGFYETIREDTNLIDSGGWPVVYSAMEFAYAESSLLSWDCVVCWNKLYKRVLFDGIFFPEGLIHEDEYVTYKVTNRAKRIVVLPTRLYYYRQRAESIVNKQYSYKRLDAENAYIERERFYHDRGEVQLELAVKARHLQWLNGQIKQFNKLEERNIQLENEIKNEQEQLQDELMSVDLIRRDFLRNNYIFPFDLVGTKKRIVLYGGGTVGQQYYLQIKATNYCNVTMWVDREYMNLRKIGIPVQDVESIRTAQNPDHYVIALANPDLARQTIEVLIEEFCVEKKKIVYCINSVMNISPADNKVFGEKC